MNLNSGFSPGLLEIIHLTRMEEEINQQMISKPAAIYLELRLPTLSEMINQQTLITWLTTGI